MSSPFQRIITGVISLAMIILAATIAFHFLGNYGWLESLWLVVITISTVGFSEHSSAPPTIQILTMLVILTGVSAAAYTSSGILQMMLQGELNRAFGVRKMIKEITKLNQHIIICGGGRLGQDLMSQLGRRQLPFVVIDLKTDRIDSFRESQTLAIAGDATSEQILIQAGLERAHALIAALPTDADNVFITLSARNLRPDIQIIAKAEHESSCPKFRQAGANKIVMPHRAGAQQMERMISRPTTADLFELFAKTDQQQMELDEFQITPNHSLANKSIDEAGIHKRFHLLVVGLKKPAGKLQFNPQASDRLTEGDTLLVMGNLNNIRAFKKEFDL